MIPPAGDRFIINQENVVAQLRETAPQRRWLGAIAPLGALFDNRVYQDPLSLFLQEWFFDFRTQLTRHPDPERGPDQIAAALIPALNGVLIDAIFGTPLTELAVLGSDGETYLPGSVERFRQILDEQMTEEGLREWNRIQGFIDHPVERAELLQRSPCYLERPAHFSLREHPVIPAFLRWRNQFVDHLPPRAPRPRGINVGAIREGRRRGNLNRAVQAQAMANYDGAVRRHLQLMQEEMQRVGAGAHEHLRRIEENEARYNERIQGIIEVDDVRVQILHHRHLRAERRAEDLARIAVGQFQDAGDLRGRADVVGGAAKDIDARVTICEAEAAKKESSWSKLLAYACIFAVGAGDYFLAEAGIPIAIGPMRDGYGIHVGL